MQPALMQEYCQKDPQWYPRFVEQFEQTKLQITELETKWQEAFHAVVNVALAPL